MYLRSSASLCAFEEGATRMGKFSLFLWQEGLVFEGKCKNWTVPFHFVTIRQNFFCFYFSIPISGAKEPGFIDKYL